MVDQPLRLNPLIAESPSSSAVVPAAPAIVRTGNKISLADHLDLRNIPLATTPGGKNFSLKALHPADPEIRSSRIPGSNRSSTALFCDMVETIPISNADEHVRIVLMPSPCVPCTVIRGATEGSMTYASYAFCNVAFGGTFVVNPTAISYAHIEHLFNNVAEQYRVAAQSVTVELVAPSTSNQGSIVSSQVVQKPQKFYGANISAYSGSQSGPTQCYAPLELYDSPPFGAQLVLGTNAFTGEARDGVYAPLKLTSLSFKDNNNPRACAGSVTGITVPTYAFTYNPYSPQIFPYPGNTGNDLYVPMFAPWSCPNYSITTVTGMAANVALRIRVRQVLEIVPYPGTVYAGAMENALPVDELALKMYAEVSSKMRDAYPASFNDLGILKDVVVKLAKHLLPFVDPVLSAASSIPGPIGLAATAASPVVRGAMPVVKQMLDKARAKRKAQKTVKKGG